MKNKNVVLLVNSSSESEELKAAFEKAAFTVVGVESDGAKGIELIRETAPSVVVSELFLRNVDGVGVMEKTKDVGCKFVALVAEADDAIISRVVKKGASYCFVKPVSVENVVETVDELISMSRHEQLGRGEAVRREASLEEKISSIFISIGVPPHIKGYGYLREGIRMAVEEPDVINNVTKVLYPKIGEKYQTSASKVERAIRHAIEVAWNRGRIDVINSIFGARVYLGHEKPTNSEFIALIADKLMLEKLL